jgi:cytochrome b6-f complex iron-sulfur subunit
MCDDDKLKEVEATPVSAPADGSRRTFFGTVAAALAGAAMVMLPSRRAQAKKVGIALAQVEDLKKVGGTATLKVKGQKLLLVRDSETSVKALDPTCSHKKCTVKFTSSDSQLHCPCHKSAYSLDGKVLGGPAPKPLVTFPAQLSGEQIVVDLPETPA